MNKETIFQAYLLSALWSSTDIDSDNFLDATHGIEDIDDNTLSKMREAVYKFIDENYTDITAFNIETETDLEQVGHSLWLNSNGHGSGFFDWFGDAADALNEAANKVPSFQLYIGDDNKIYSL